MKKEVIEKFVTLITAAFGFIAALAWNSAVQELFREIFPTTKTLIAMFTYAIFVTTIAVFVTIWFAKISKK
ncbi:MAG: DUF5654 family protein [archaeon]